MSNPGQSLDWRADVPGEIPASSLTQTTDRHGSRRIVPAHAFRYIVTITEVVIDFLTSAAAVFLAYYVYYGLRIGRHVHYPTRNIALFSVIVGILIVLLFERDSEYRGSTSLLQIRETERALRIPCVALVLLLPLSLFFNDAFSRGTLVSLAITLPILLMLQKYLFFSVVRKFYARGYGVKKVLIYGAGYTGRRIFTALVHSPKLGFAPVAIADEDPKLDGKVIHELGYSRKHSLTVRHAHLTADYLRSTGCDALFVAIPSASRETTFAAALAANQANVQMAFLPDSRHLNATASESVDLDGLLLTFAGDRAPAWHYRIVKRAMDIILSTAVLLLASPLLLLVAVCIPLESHGPAMFRQERIGKDGRRFSIFKFRTMYVDAPKYATSPIRSTDRRITKIGRYLRKTSCDELPQLLNVLRGEMSLVGPRPEMPFLVEKYSPVQRQRLQVIPGITGLWQLSADRAFLIHESPEYDMYYIRNCGFFMDVAILFHTVLFAMQGI
jgi:exopolysaccharide biosynthesis polyprenyl glycosylphosphotransferase